MSALRAAYFHKAQRSIFSCAERDETHACRRGDLFFFFLHAAQIQLKIKTDCRGLFCVIKCPSCSRPPFADDFILIARPDFTLEQPSSRARVPFRVEMFRPPLAK